MAWVVIRVSSAGPEPGVSEPTSIPHWSGDPCRTHVPRPMRRSAVPHRWVRSPNCTGDKKGVASQAGLSHSFDAKTTPKITILPWCGVLAFQYAIAQGVCGGRWGSGSWKPFARSTPRSFEPKSQTFLSVSMPTSQFNRQPTLRGPQTKAQADNPACRATVMPVMARFRDKRGPIKYRLD